MEVLVIDDEATARHAAAQTLQQAGFHVVTAASGPEALDVLTTRSIGLVVCDWNMPQMTGLDVCRQLRSGPIERYVYVILLTVNDSPEHLRQGLAAGADEFMTKPFCPKELILRASIGRRIIEQEGRAITLFALARLAESRDHETGGHIRRVSQYCRLLAEELSGRHDMDVEIDGEFIRLVGETSALHDIGKVAIPDQILRKPAPLTADEFAVMKTHTLHGAKALAEMAAEFPDAMFLRMARDIALCHHERFDGSGYPSGLSGEEIPLAARIVALADAYDAITSRRSYKVAYSHELAKSLIVADSGSHFDPRVVEAFLANEQRFRCIRLSVPPPKNSTPPLPLAGEATTSRLPLAPCHLGDRRPIA